MHGREMLPGRFLAHADMEDLIGGC